MTRFCFNQLNSRARFQDHPPPVFIDEIQYAPCLFPTLVLDRPDKGQGKFPVRLATVSDDEAYQRIPRRTIGILNLAGLSLRNWRNSIRSAFSAGGLF